MKIASITNIFKSLYVDDVLNCNYDIHFVFGEVSDKKLISEKN